MSLRGDGGIEDWDSLSDSRQGAALVPSRRSLSDIPASSRRFRGNNLFLFSHSNKTTTTTRRVSFKIKEQQVTTTPLPEYPLLPTSPSTKRPLSCILGELGHLHSGVAHPPHRPPPLISLSLSLTLPISHTNTCYTQTTWRSLVKDIQEESFSTNTLFLFFVLFVVCLFCDRLEHCV